MIDLVKIWVKRFQHNPRDMARNVAEAAFRELRDGDMDWDGLRDTSKEVKELVIADKGWQTKPALSEYNEL
jgi:hypothetical protein